MTTGLLVSLLALAVTPGSPPLGEVVYHTRARAYLNKGAVDGLHTGMLLQLRHRGKTYSCRIDGVATSFATCPRGKVITGAVFSLPKVQPRVVAFPSRRSPKPTRSTLRRWRQTLADAAFEKVRYRNADTTPDVRIGTFYAAGETTSSRNVAWYQSGVGLALPPQRIGNGWRAAAAAQLRLQDGLQNRVLAADRQPRVYLGQLLLEHDVGKHLVLRSGRFLPYRAPGTPSIDGVQIGWHATQRDVEFGVYAGSQSGILRTPRQISANTLGLYVGGNAHGQTGLRGEVRLAMVRYARSLRVELEPLLGLSAGGITVRLGGAVAHDGSPMLNKGSLAVGWRLGETLALNAEARYLHPATMTPFVAAPYRPSLPSQRGTLRGLWHPSDWVQVHLHATVVSAGEAWQRLQAGSDIELPRLLGSFAGVALGYRQALGWINSRSVRARLFGIGGGLSWQLIGSYNTNTTSPSQRTLYTTASIQGTVAFALRVRASVFNLYAPKYRENAVGAFLHLGHPL